VYAGENGQALDYGQFTISAAPPPGADTDKLEAAIDDEIATLLDKGVQSAEVEAAKNRLAADAIKARDSLRGPAEIVGSALVTGITLDDVQSWPERVAAVTPADVLKAAKDVLAHKENSVTGVMLPAQGVGVAGPVMHQPLSGGVVQ